MAVDVILMVLFTLVTVAFTVLGVYLATEHPIARKLLIALGLILVAVMIAQGARQIFSQSSADDAYMNIRQDMEKQKQNYSQKVDSLFGLLQPKLTTPSQLPGSHRLTEKKSQQPQPTQPQPAVFAHLSITQSSKISTRPDAPYETEAVVQTDQVFPALKFLMQCDKPLVDAAPTIGGTEGVVQMMVSSGLAKDHPNVVVYSYGSSTPPFGPANPLVIDVWSKEPVKCSQVATF